MDAFDLDPKVEVFTPGDGEAAMSGDCPDSGDCTGNGCATQPNCAMPGP